MILQMLLNQTRGGLLLILYDERLDDAEYFRLVNLSSSTLQITKSLSL